MTVGYGVTANITASHESVRGSSGFDSPYPNYFSPAPVGVLLMVQWRSILKDARKEYGMSFFQVYNLCQALKASC